MHRPIIVHIGYPKTGTTTLQRRLFGAHPTIVSIGKPKPSGFGASLIEAFTTPQVSGERLSELAATWRTVAAKTDRQIVLSHEGLSAPDLYRGDFGTPLPERMRQVFGQARIMIGIRNQVDLFESFYLHKTRPDSYYTPEQFAEEASAEIDNWDFAAMADRYAAIFGKEQVGLFQLELIETDLTRYATRLAEFMGLGVPDVYERLRAVKDNARKSRRIVVYAAIRSRIPIGNLSRFLPGTAPLVERILKSGKPAQVKLTKPFRCALRKRYVQSNLKLQEKFQVRLD